MNLRTSFVFSLTLGFPSLSYAASPFDESSDEHAAIEARLDDVDGRLDSMESTFGHRRRPGGGQTRADAEPAVDQLGPRGGGCEQKQQHHASFLPSAALIRPNYQGLSGRGGPGHAPTVAGA
jgi:hypothetical protein